MSRQEQNDRHIIWSDISLDLDDWRESLEELYPGYSDDELYDIMVKSNAENLYDERVNLNIQLSQPIIVIGDLGRWNGRVSGYKMIDSGNIKDCLYCPGRDGSGDLLLSVRDAHRCGGGFV